MKTSRVLLSLAAVVTIFGAIITLSVQQAKAQAKEMLPLAQQAPALALPLTRIDQWRASCTVDGGASADIYDDVDGGIHCASQLKSCAQGGGYSSVHITNDNAVCAHIGGDGVKATQGFEIGTGAGCIDGPSVVLDTQSPLECTSAGAAVLVRVKAGK